MTATTSSEFCRRILPEVSRTFALNVPVLPSPLDQAVTVAYLLCRIADTLEEPHGSMAVRADLLAELASLVQLPTGWQERIPGFTESAVQVVRPETPPSEKKLLAETGQVLQAFAELPSWTRPAIARCIEEMTRGMAEVGRHLEKAQGPVGLPDLQATMDYCYYVAGTVGDMLTQLFIEYTPKVATRADALVPKAQAFGRVLQLTNILKDIREDLLNGSCWLPIPMMEARGLNPQNLLSPENREKAVDLVDELVGIAKKEAELAFDYTLTLPADEVGLRLFCLWPLLFAVKTLATLESNPQVFEPSPVKIGRIEVAKIMAISRIHVSNDAQLKALFRECSRA